jgi:alpha-mannosidase
MLPRTFLTQLIPPRIAEALRRIEARIWRFGEPIKAVQQTKSFTAHRTIESLTDADFAPVPEDGFSWGPKFAQRWFRLLLPQADQSGPRYLRWEDQAEATAYVDGVPYYGIDLAHRYCPLPEHVREVWVEAVCVKTGIWVTDSAEPITAAGSRYAFPRLVYRDDCAWQVYHDLRVLFDVMEAECMDYQPDARKAFVDPIRYSAPFFRATPLLRRWCARLDAAIDVLDASGLRAFQAELQQIYGAFPADASALRAVLTGHAHIDLVWLWPERVGEFKAVHSWATQTRLMELYPEFRFGYSQPASYAAVGRRAPALHAKVRDLIRAGRWEATGGAYVECDTQLPCGEGLVRALRCGQAEFAALRGTPSKVCWLPDVFGYSAVMPQLLRAFGIEGFFTTKLSWNAVNRLPHTSFRWRGMDGAAVAAHIVHLHDYNEAVDIRRLREDALHHQQAGVHPEFLVPTGYGDGGGGPTEEMCERARRIRDLAGAPRTEWGGIEEFFDRLSLIAPELPEVAGELLFELHRGVFTTHSTLKASFRALERSLQILEAVHVVRADGPVDEHLWRRLIFAQFHDYIPGSSIWEVYAEGVPELMQLAERAQRAARSALLGNSDVDGWFNPLPLPRTWIVGGVCYVLAPLQGGSSATLGRRAVTAPTATGLSLTSDRVRARLRDDGGLAQLTIDGCDVALAGEGHRLSAYSDHPAKFEAWDVDRPSLVTGWPARLVGGPVVETGGLTAGLTFHYAIGERSTISVTYSVSAAEQVLRLDYQVDWQDPELWLKAILSTRYLGREARFGAPFGSVLRNQWPGHTREEAQWEVPGSRWMAVMDDAQAEGLAIMTEAKYGFTVRDGIVGVSLLRSALVTGADEHPEIRETPNRPRYSDLGPHRIRLALGRFTRDSSVESQPAALADVLFTPCLPYAGAALNAGFLGIFDAPSLVPAWAEPGEDGSWTLRLHETLGRFGRARLLFDSGWQVAQVGLAEPRAESWTSGEIHIDFDPYQIVSIQAIRTSTAGVG